jgi:hypothetical protein
MNPAVFSVDLDSQAAYVSYRPSARIAQQVRVVRGRTGRLGAIPYGPPLSGTPHLIAEYDAAGEVVGVQLHGISRELIGLADEFLGLVDLALPAPLARTLLR